MNPVLPLPFLIPLLAFVVGVGAFLSWKSTSQAKVGLRKVLLALRLILLIALALFLLNPGKWQPLHDETKKVWFSLLDDSASMSVEFDSKDPVTRAEVAARLARDLSTQAKDEDIEVKSLYFSENLSSTSQNVSGLATDLATVGDELLSQISAEGDAVAGIVIFSDGRQTRDTDTVHLALRAQALNIPFHTVPIGDHYDQKDLALSLPRKTLTVFPDQNVQISVVLSSKGLDSLKTPIILSDNEGVELARDDVKVSRDEQTIHTFSIPAPETSQSWHIEVPAQEQERRLSNNISNVHIRILTEKARLFLAEGSPYWDSKFLAQLLRKQNQMDVQSVHRLSDSRWFRVDSGESRPHESLVNVFPDTAEKLRTYDLIVFGKSSEHFLTPERSQLLRDFVKDQGGAVLFSRAKPYNGKLPGLEPLEPVTWASGKRGEFMLRPSSDGQSVGLFGQALPAPDSSIWSSLPLLKDANLIDEVKPFTRVLAHGEQPNMTLDGRFPLLMIRRYGQGVSGLVNADGLWKWDFYPEARELGNMYEEYWTQLMYWMLSYSEFLPGHDHALRLSSSSIRPGEPIAFKISYRGQGVPENLAISVTSSELDQPITLSPALDPTNSQGLKWSGSFTPNSPGNYTFTLQDPSAVKNAPLPEAILTVLPLKAEMDELNGDPDFLSHLANSTGGQFIPVDEFSTFLKESIVQEPPSPRDKGVSWKPSWLYWFIPFLLIIAPTVEWFLRRRNGML